MNKPEADIPVRNNTKMTMHVGGYMISPGETRILPAHHVPKALWPKTVEKEAAAPAADPLLNILDQSIPKIIEAIAERDTNGVLIISDEDLAKLEAAEEAGNTRKGVMSAFEEEKLIRAQTSTDATPPADAEMDDFAKTLEIMSEDELINQLDTYADNEVMLGAVNNEIDHRSMMDAFAGALPIMSEDELTKQLEIYAADERMLEAVNVEIARRAQG